MSVHLTRCLALVAAPCAWPRAGCNCPTPTCRGGRHARPAFARRDVAVRTNRASLASPYAALRWADEEGNATPVAGTRALHARGRAVRVQAKEDERDEMVVAELPVAEAEVSLEAEAAQEAAAPFRAFVAGASGGVGVKLVRELVAMGVPVVAMVRDKARATKDGGVLLDHNVTLVEGDVCEYDTLPAAVAGCDVLLCATGSRPALDPLGPFSVDYQGTKNLVVAAARAKVRHFVFVTSIGTDDLLFPLNLFWGVLFWKKRAEEELKKSGMTYTVVRPGGLLDKPRDGAASAGNVVMKAADAFGLPPRESPGSILREQVAQVCVAALTEPAAANKVVEIIAKEDAPPLSFAQLFEGVPADDA